MRLDKQTEIEEKGKWWLLYMGLCDHLLQSHGSLKGLHSEIIHFTAKYTTRPMERCQNYVGWCRDASEIIDLTGAKWIEVVARSNSKSALLRYFIIFSH